jgi:hypothetical protein
MPSYVVEGTFRGRLYAGPSLETALAVLQRERHDCLILHQGPSDAEVFCDGVLLKTEIGANGTLGIAKARHPLHALVMGATAATF